MKKISLKRNMLCVASVMLAFSLVGCGNIVSNKASSSKTQSSSTAATSSMTASEKQARISRIVQTANQKFDGQKASDFLIRNISGENVRLSDYGGQNIIIEIAKSTCKACIKTYPEMEKFKKDNPSIKVFNIYYDATSAVDMTNFFNENKLTADFDSIAGNDDPQIQSYKIGVTPTFFFIDKTLTIRKIDAGNTTESHLEQDVAESLS